MSISSSNMTAQKLMEQAGMTAESYLIDGLQTINKHFGDGYAETHPALLAAYMQCAATDFATTFGSDRLDAIVGELGCVLASGFGALAEAMGDSKAKRNGGLSDFSDLRERLVKLNALVAKVPPKPKQYRRAHRGPVVPRPETRCYLCGETGRMQLPWGASTEW